MEYELDAAGAVVCAGHGSCLTASAAAAQMVPYGDWSTLLTRSKSLNAARPPYCPRRLSGCPWPSCSKLRGGRSACAAAGVHAPVRCRDRRLGPSSGQKNCWMLDRGETFTQERTAQCSGSLSEEQFALHRYFGGHENATFRGGAFLELGAYDGWMESNTLHAESCLGWRGIVMDGQPAHLEWLRRNRPEALSLGVAVCPHVGFVNYSTQRATTSGILSYMSRSVRSRFRVAGMPQVSVPCAPLGAWLALLRVRHLDLFSLDVQGAELMVLQTIDWSALTVGVLLSECKALGCDDPQDHAVKALLTQDARLRWAGVLRARHDVWDAVYVNESLWAKAHTRLEER